jgi:hypothetical protein
MCTKRNNLPPDTSQAHRTCVLCIRATPAEADRVRRASVRSGKTLSEYGRGVLLRAAKRQ